MTPEATAYQMPPPTPEFLDDDVLRRVQYRLHRLARAFRLKPDQVEDWRQDMICELLRAAERFDPRRCRKSTFVNGVLDVFVRRILSRRRQRSGHRHFRPRSLHGIPEDLEPACNVPGRGPTEQDLVDLRLDFETVLPRMPERLQAICLCLMAFSASQTARLLEVAPSTVSRAMPRIRQCLVEAGFGGFWQGHAKNRPLRRIRREGGERRRQQAMKALAVKHTGTADHQETGSSACAGGRGVGA